MLQIRRTFEPTPIQGDVEDIRRRLREMSDAAASTSDPLSRLHKAMIIGYHGLMALRAHLLSNGQLVNPLDEHWLLVAVLVKTLFS